MRIRGTLIICCAVIASALVSASSVAQPVAAPAASYTDNFDGPNGSLPSSAIWSLDLGGGGWGNGELQTYTNNPANIRLDGQGHLLITAQRVVGSNGQVSYTSARISTRGKVSFPYGTLSARIALPQQKGLNAAFWMLGSDLPRVGYPASGEIDAVEAPDRAHRFYTVHGPTTSGSGWSIGNGGTANATGFHVYSVTHTAGRIQIAVDGTTVGVLRRQDLAANQLWAFDKGFDALLNVAVGGSFAGAPDASTAFPATMAVDWVRFDS